MERMGDVAQVNDNNRYDQKGRLPKNENTKNFSKNKMRDGETAEVQRD